MVLRERMIGGLLLSFRRLVIVTDGWRVAGDSCAAGLLLWFGHWCITGGVSWTPGVRPMCPVSSGLDFQARVYGDSSSIDPGRCFRHP